LKLKDPGAVLELIAVMELGIVRGSIDPHFVDDFEPAVSEPAQGIGMTLVLLAMMLIVNLGPDAARETLLRKKVDPPPNVIGSANARFDSRLPENWPDPSAIGYRLLPIGYALRARHLLPRHASVDLLEPTR
jgi:hypothetical protein